MSLEENNIVDLEECRELLAGLDLTDEQMLELRDSILTFANNVLEHYFNELMATTKRMKN